jgi:DNA (cytosine-5)-methyltransferase 1
MPKKIAKKLNNDTSLKNTHNYRKKEIKVLDLFSGCGGLSFGLEKVGFRVIAGIDNWTDALKTFQKNHKDAKALTVDLGKPDLDAIKKEIGDVDVVVGGPPCQGFSISGNRDLNDPRNKLYKGFVQIVKRFNPKVFVLENVPNLVSIGEGKIKDEIIKDFEKLGYKVKYKILLASDYGVPQNRRRVIFVGVKGENNFEFPIPMFNEGQKKVSSSDAISDLPDHDMQDGSFLRQKPRTQYQEKMRTKDSKIFNHVLTAHDKKTVEIISLVPDGGNYKDLPQEHINTRRVNIAWTRFNSTKPSNTIDTGHRHHFHYKYNRVPTVRESARLQSFPDDFIFLGSKTSQYKQVGNAVPPLLAEAIGKNILKLFDKK